MGKYLAKIREWWLSLEKRQKVIYSSLLAGLILVVIVSVILLNKVTYSFFLSGVEQSEAGNIISKLEEMNIKYKVTPGGSIYVADVNVNELRMKMAAQGTLGGTNRGYDLLSNQGFGATSYDKQVNYQIALEGELSKSISTIQGVKYSRVHLVIPPRTYYQVGETAKPRASVLLILDTGYTLKSDQVMGIVNFITGSVQGLERENVKVVDNYSNDLTASVTDYGVGNANTKFQLKKQLEDYYSEKVEQNLQTIFGLGNVVVIPEINLNWEKIESEERELKPSTKDKGIILSQQNESQESYDNNSTQGVVGTDSNVPPFTYQSPENADGILYKNSKTITNYDVGEIYKKTVEDKNGEISSKSFTVFVDFQKANIPENDEIKQQFTQAISNAVGTSQENITVMSMAFNREYETIRAELEQNIKEKNDKIILILTLIISVSLLTLLMFVVMKLMKRRKTRKIIEERKRKLESRVKEVVSELEEETIEEYTPAQEAQKKLEEIVDARPEDVAEIIKIWINSQ
ncbi:flagellar basal-body MS-ring/collar protein FliF [Oceanotoga sp. DSM 15011]|uniref:flagellar basal-body MS-ring/collar protein FliF n=1 Tax=Oceanotoga sp. DSM 15011 TaxID=2984951 RepID=UPI0021F484F6|nr:flagellar basal-body MS-ring/collar protein FliF [Oceanotoga sp. DSM 15011]UYP00412.1 flagellar basal-body MS-ring/collar protein FliF [Oceanotoga sp. DSM 15011]